LLFYSEHLVVRQIYKIRVGSQHRAIVDFGVTDIAEKIDLPLGQNDKKFLVDLEIIGHPDTAAFDNFFNHGCLVNADFFDIFNGRIEKAALQKQLAVNFLVNQNFLIIDFHFDVGLWLVD
jgi:hypothetical protein